MKKILIAAAALSAAGTAWANTSPEEVELTKPVGGELKSGNSAFEWDTGTYGNDFNNWEVTFELTIAQTPQNNNSLFSTTRSSGRATGSIFSINADGTVQWAGGNKSDSAWATLGGGAKTITLSYDGSILTATNGEGDSVTLEASGANFTSGQASLWTNGGRETFSNITLKGENVIPEPSAFGLLAGIGALALVASRRRRR